MKKFKEFEITEESSANVAGGAPSVKGTIEISGVLDGEKKNTKIKFDIGVSAA